MKKEYPYSWPHTLVQTKIPKSQTLKATITHFTDDRKPWVKAQSYTFYTHVFHYYFPSTFTYVKICHTNNLGLRCELGLLRVDVPMSKDNSFWNPELHHLLHWEIHVLQNTGPASPFPTYKRHSSWCVLFCTQPGNSGHSATHSKFTLNKTLTSLSTVLIVCSTVAGPVRIYCTSVDC